MIPVLLRIGPITIYSYGLMMAIGTVIVMWPNVRERAALAVALGRDEALGAEPVPGGD